MLHGDRWIEMDLIWFDPDQPLNPQIDLLLSRLAPLWKTTDGMHGLCFNVGWLIDLVTEWTGDGTQQLPLRSRRTAAWAARTYTDLRDFVSRFREGAVRHGLPDLRIGTLCVGWAHVVWPPDLKIYDFQSDWYARHPELYGGPNTIIGMPDLWPTQRLKADSYPYAAYPNGIGNGTYFPNFFGAQWGRFAAYVGFDALHLRDGMTGPMVYTRVGPYGQSIPADVDWSAWTQAVLDLHRAIKRASPQTFLIAYSSAISATAEWRVGCIDLERLVAEGVLDAWVDQTWGGAWQDWWHQLWKGWTFQLANLLIHRVQIESANQLRHQINPNMPLCRHYHLIETWDGWEHWDTLHQVPDKLRWAMWAFSHAAAVTPDGIRTTDGSYISWANHRSGKLLSADDVDFLSTHLDRAQDSAAHLDHVNGALLVYNRPMLEWLMDNHPDWNASEWIEDQVGLLMKWGVPCLGATRIEWLPQVIDSADALIVQVAGQLEAQTQTLLLQTTVPILLLGRADLIDPLLLQRCGARIEGDIQASGFYHFDMTADLIHLPTFQPITAQHPDQPDDLSQALKTEAGSLATTSGTTSEAGFFGYWQSPDWAEPANPYLQQYQLGSTRPYHLIAAHFNRTIASAVEVDWQAPVCFHSWRDGDALYILLGNLETGILGNSGTPRVVALRLVGCAIPPGQSPILRRVDGKGEAAVAPDSCDEDQLIFNKIEVEPQGAAVYRLEFIGAV